MIQCGLRPSIAARLGGRLLTLSRLPRYTRQLRMASARRRYPLPVGHEREEISVLSEEEKTKIGVRLRRIAGQVSAVQRMVDDDTYCVDTLTQIAAASGALSKVSEIILESHIRSCVAESLREGSESDKDKKLEELIALFRKFGRPG